MFKIFITVIISILFQNFVFGQTYDFEANKNSHTIYQIKNDNEIDYLFIYKDTSRGFEFEILDNNLNFISKGEYSGDYFYQVLDYLKSIKKVGDKVAITKFYIHQNSYSYPVEASYIFDIKTGKFEKLFYQRDEIIAVSENPMSYQQIDKARLANSYTSFTPYYKDNIKVHAETNVMSKVMLFANIKESHIKTVDESGTVEDEISYSKSKIESLQYISLVGIVDEKSFFIESNFETKRKFSYSNLIIVNNITKKPETTLELNQEQKPFLEIKSLSKNNDKFILLGLYKAATKFSSDISDKPYAGVFRWVIDKNGNTISRNLFGWTRLINQLNFYIGKDEEKSNYLYPVISFETKNGYSIILKDKNEDEFGIQKNNQFLINFDQNHQIVSSKNYLHKKNELVDIFYDNKNMELKILEHEMSNKKLNSLKVTDESFKTIFTKQFDLSSELKFFISQSHILILKNKDEKNKYQLSLLPINL